MTERLQGLEVFVAAVDAGSFSAAAERMGLTRSAVGKGIARLEARLGVRLLHRTTRRLSLTHDGQDYYERCRRMLAELDAAEADLDAKRHEPVGRLRVSMPDLIGRHCIAPLLMELGREYPRLSFDLSFSDRRVDLIEERVDLALRSGPLADSTVLAARSLGQQRVGVYASPAYLVRHPRPRGLDELRAQRGEHSFIGYARDGDMKPWLFRDAERRVIEFLPTARLSCDSIEVIAQAGADGLGLVRIPCWLASHRVAAGELERVFDEAYAYGYEFSALWPRMRVMPQRLRVAIDRLVERVPAILTTDR